MTTHCNYCVVVICGLPGVGKTSFTRKVCSLVESLLGMKGIHLEYDQFEQQQKHKQPGIYEEKSISEEKPFDSQAWKSARDLIAHFVENLLSGSLPTDNTVYVNVFDKQIAKSTQNLFIFLDDNMYYHSMRFSFFKMCQKYKSGFVQVFLKAPTELAIQNDKQRPAHLQVGSQIIEQMKSKMEEPDPGNNTWEKHTITIDASTLDFSDQASLHKILDEIIVMSQDALPEVQVEDEEAKERSRIANYESTIHQFDLRSRKLLATLIPKNTSKAGAVAARLNQKRKDFLQALRTTPDKFTNGSLEDLENLFVEEANKMVQE